MDTTSHQQKTLLNLGCGLRFHPEWTNVDFVSQAHGVIAADLRKGIPFPAGAFDAVYHSHVLEHFAKKDAVRFLQECHRVLKSGSVIRVAVPDLERIVRLYLEALEGSVQGEADWRHHYEWMMLEMYDQTVREKSGGDMAAYLRQETIPNLQFVIDRMGGEARRVLDAVRASRGRQKSAPSAWSKLVRFCRDAVFRKETIARLLLGADAESFKLGQFRRGGEIHLWMYDRFSLANVLRTAGFQEPHVVAGNESRIPQWSSYHLDTEPDGTLYKPDSLYMEATKA